MPSDQIPADAITAAAEALAVHRWKTMGVRSVECECGAVRYGDADPFPADVAFRVHLAEAALEAAAPLIAAQAAATEREAIHRIIDAHGREDCPDGECCQDELLGKLLERES